MNLGGVVDLWFWLCGFFSMFWFAGVGMACVSAVLDFGFGAGISGFLVGGFTNVGFGVGAGFGWGCCFSCLLFGFGSAFASGVGLV